MFDDPIIEILSLLKQILRELEDISFNCSSIDSNTGELTSISIAVDDIKENL